MSKDRENSLIQRLHIVSGQINGLARLIEKNERCEKITAQFYAINSGIKKVMELYFKENLEACFKFSGAKNRKKIDFLLREIIKNK